MTLFGKIIFGGLTVVLLMGVFYGTRMYVNQDQGQVITEEKTIDTNPPVVLDATADSETQDSIVDKGTTSAATTTKVTTTKATSTKVSTKATSTIQIKVATSSDSTSTVR